MIAFIVPVFTFILGFLAKIAYDYFSNIKKRNSIANSYIHKLELLGVSMRYFYESYFLWFSKDKSISVEFPVETHLATIEIPEYYGLNSIPGEDLRFLNISSQHFLTLLAEGLNRQDYLIGNIGKNTIAQSDSKSLIHEKRRNIIRSIFELVDINESIMGFIYCARDILLEFDSININYIYIDQKWQTISSLYKIGIEPQYLYEFFEKGKEGLFVPISDDQLLYKRLAIKIRYSYYYLRHKYYLLLNSLKEIRLWQKQSK